MSHDWIYITLHFHGHLLNRIKTQEIKSEWAQIASIADVQNQIKSNQIDWVGNMSCYVTSYHDLHISKSFLFFVFCLSFKFKLIVCTYRIQFDSIRFFISLPPSLHVLTATHLPHPPSPSSIFPFPVPVSFSVPFGDAVRSSVSFGLFEGGGVWVSFFSCRGSVLLVLFFCDGIF